MKLKRIVAILLIIVLNLSCVSFVCLGYVISGKIYDVMTYIINAFTF